MHLGNIERRLEGY